ncbi:YkgJ family cysteine cluster protein [Natronorubrum aibiense]|uniref:YkgJ family cysteine cluster protein n=1 Tax=Natronorubrum aibiense TaxID=348826 RepID=A0A5P9P1K2_9EURY|nr:YkgJ family cysteine cluster protein [Natronorubrum aibiense]QFU82003.1 YkgJ family cysteine cluster protein [Natronorubrum aibiense]
MEVNCEGCAGCCLDWRPLLEAEGDGTDHQRRRPFDDSNATRAPLDDDPIFVPLTRDEIRAFLEAGLAAALTPRFWHARETSEGVEIDGRSIAAVAGRPVFFVGLQKPPKPVAPVGREEPTWLPTCVFLDPTTLQCRVHGGEHFPEECGAYPKHTLALEQETECERVESAGGGERLLDAAVDDDLDGLLLGSQALGAKLFAHPQPDVLEGVIDRAANGALTATDRAECLAVAAASSPGTLATSDYHYEQALDRALKQETDASWVGPAIREWQRRRDAAEGVPSPAVAERVEDERGAPETPGWDALE